jgi:replication factor C subunit 2/4
MSSIEQRQQTYDRIPWIEKYRPRTIDDIILDDNMMVKIKQIIEKKDMPNIIITGVPGIGKTTTIRCIARGLYGKHVNDAVLEINASDDRGIKAVQETIMNFCKKKMDVNNKTHDTEKYAEHKIIILDEADNMTEKAQNQINNLMEKFHKTTRFAITCNTSSDINESIQSRCIILRYVRLTNEQVIRRLKIICDIEKVEYEEESLQAIAFISQGDIRAAVNNLQLVYNGYGQLTVDYVYTVCGKPQPVIIKKIFSHCHNKNFAEALKITMSLKEKGFSESDIVLTMLNVLKLPDLGIDEATKIKFMNTISNSAYIISKGIDNPVQLTACIAKLILD